MTRLAPLLFAAVALAGCGTTTIDVDKAETQISDAVTEQIGSPVKSVDCPASVDAKTGATFTCAVTADDGTKGEVLVTQKDAEGNVNYTAPFVQTARLQERIASDLREQIGGEITLDCPDIYEGEKGDSFKCDASGDGDTATVLVTLTDDDGNVRYEVVEQ